MRGSVGEGVIVFEPMCSESCLSFVKRHLTSDEVAGRRVLEVGARNVNGTVRPLITALGPSEYVGVDIEAGPGVDELCSIEEVEERFGPETFDVVITTEVMEHVRDWKRAISNLKRVCRPKGTILVTTRSFGFAYHAFPRVRQVRTVVRQFRLLAQFTSRGSLRSSASARGVR